MFSFSQVDSLLGESISQGFTDTLIQSLTTICTAEIFSRTWFVILLMALKHDKVILTGGCFLAMAVHIGIAGALNESMYHAFPMKVLWPVLYLSSTAFYLALAFLNFRERYQADEKEEVALAAINEPIIECESQDYGSIGKGSALFEQRVWSTLVPHCTMPFLQCFVTVLIVESFDRTRSLMVSQNWFAPSTSPAYMGSLAAFFLLTLSAVAIGFAMRNLLSSKMSLICACSACSFTILAILPIHDLLNQKWAYCVLCRDGLEPYIAMTQTEPQFLIRTLSPYIETISHQSIHNSGMWEWHVYSEIRDTLTSMDCARNAHQPMVSLLDFGSNVGFFTLYGLKLGCSVLAIDVGSVHLDHLKFSVWLNDIDNRKFNSVRGFVTNHTGQMTYSYGSSVYQETVPAFRIDELLHDKGLDTGPRIPIAKMDVEDGVAAALQGAKRTLRTHRVQKWIVEIWNPTKVPNMQSVLANVVSMGYRGRFMCCDQWHNGKDFRRPDCEFADVDEFSKAWPVVFGNGSPWETTYCDTMLEPVQ